MYYNPKTRPQPRKLRPRIKKILQQNTKQILTNLSVATSEVQPRLTKNADEAAGIWQRCLRKIISTLIKGAKLI